MNRQDTIIGRLDEIRARFQQPRSAVWRDKPEALWRFTVLSVRKARDDELGIQAAALAFTTLIAFIPLLTAFSLVGARTVGERAEIIELLTQILPYSEQVIVQSLEQFLGKTRQLSVVGVAVFLVTVLFAFTTIERTVNRIWQVTQNRPFKVRLTSFTLVLFWPQLIVGLSYWGLHRLEQEESFQRLAATSPAQLLPFAATLVGLTLICWRLPYTSVRFHNAFLGGLLSTVLLEGLRRGFGLYVEMVPSVSLIYGSLGAAFFFMISIYAAWWIILLGSELTYCLQNFKRLARRPLSTAGMEGSWLALLALVTVAERFRRGTPITPHEVLSEELRLPTSDLLQVLNPLLDDGLLIETGGDTEGFLLGGDPHELPLTRIYDLYEPAHWSLGPTIGSPVEELRARITDQRGRLMADLKLSDLLTDRSEHDKRVEEGTGVEEKTDAEESTGAKEK